MNFPRWLIAMAILSWFPVGAAADFDAARRQMAVEIAADAARAATWTGREELSPRVMAAMGKVERHRFVPAALAPQAYLNRPLPIGEGQTISQPFIVALMSDLLDLSPGDKVLEVGTGSGYQAAVLAELGARVFSIEILAGLSREADRALRAAGYSGVLLRVGDGWAGWPEQAPFDAIVVTAAPETIPPPLVDQLRVGGRMVIPLGPQGAAQELVVAEKQADGSMVRRRVLPVAFVPFTGEGTRR
ncbi:MAG: protein-L-isoaspartate(D-aspartate) O-methyltransferase [Sulfuritalea sp.]|nr:protein-L-isoaspartate(D-aspartate) O-methyltransferase [Sulfuritalea sp.]